jgi:Bacterial membrane protein YfhO
MLSRSVRGRPTLAAALVYTLLALVLIGPGLVPGRALSASDYLWSAAPWQQLAPAGATGENGLGSNYEMADAALVFQPFHEWARGPLPDVPLWNPHLMAGRPFVANAQSALFSPFTWPMLVLPFWWSLGVVAVLKLVTAAMGAFLLGRALGMRFAGSLMTGLVFGFGLFFVVWLPWPLSSVWAWLPWVLLGVDVVVRRPGAAPVAGLAAVVALQFFGGHPESSFHVLAVASLFALLRLSRSEQRLAAVGRLLAALVAGSALAAVAIAPFAELLARSADLAEREGKLPAELEARFILGFAFPEWWGRPSHAQTAGFMGVRSFYVGALPLMLAAWALVARPTRERVAIAVTAAAVVLVVIGAPGALEVLTALPGFHASHNTRLIIVSTLAIALLAGWGLDEVMEGVARPRLLVGGALAIVVLPVLVALAWNDPGVERAMVVATWLVFAGAGAALLWLRPRAFAVLACGLVAVDLLRVGMGQNPSIPVDHARQPVTPAIERLQAARPARFAGLQPGLGLEPLAPDTAMRYGLYDARGYDYPVERRYDTLWRRAVAPPEDRFTIPTMRIRPDDQALRALGLLGVTDIIQPPAEPAVPGWEVTYDGPDARLYSNPHALPRTWVVGSQEVVADEDAALDAILDPAFDAGRTAVVERPINGLAGEGEAEIVRYEPDRVELAATADDRALVVLSDIHMPGWRATVDGREAPIERVDYLLRGVPVDAGEHRVVFEYRPASWRIGWIVSVLAAAGLLAAVWKSGRRWAAR